MSNILYNANSKLVSKYQKKSVLATTVRPLLNQDKPFQCVHAKDSREYLMALCCDIYPAALHPTIKIMSNWELSVQALFSLFLKNFVKSWYGDKIPTTDDELIVILFQLCNRLIKHIDSSTVDWLQILCSDIPFVLDRHFKIMSRVVHEDLNYSDFLQLYLYKNQYPGCIVQKLTEPLRNESRLQQTFLSGLVGDLLFDKVANKVAAPVILLDIIQSTCDKLLQENGKTQEIPASSLTLITRSELLLRKGSHFVSYLTSAFSSKTSQSTLHGNQHIPCAHLYLFTFIKNILLLDRRKPVLYSLLKLCQSTVDSYNPLNHMMVNFINNIINQKVLTSSRGFEALKSLRHTLFPNDNKLGPEKVEPTEEEMIKLRCKCVNSMWDVCTKYRLSKFLAVTKQDLEIFMEALCKDIRMNRFLICRLSEYLLTQLA
ncbi:Nvj3p Ecym_4188 [Eremothecium cymbalariae DBVPG|uniref:PXA domain-containing protein n=1 Tax=Eremothecium cymbalariae (strain CBS 270.75 / DBVPG 7215 / KCTC 17166 / NRRL Y-17582) TaxID=931890 RepID=G8JTB1_ERECY|nr:hypothetical protein Ecym_4188 [Eremothecium cymbalariae DBVPG\